MFKVSFSEGFDTHCQTQSFYFDKSGLLIRHDYTAAIISTFRTTIESMPSMFVVV